MKFLMMSGDTKNAIETAVLRDNGDSGKVLQLIRKSQIFNKRETQISDLTGIGTVRQGC